ncbi:MAG: HAD hydrolase-like protein [Thermodesulfobacteriota bacterium]
MRHKFVLFDIDQTLLYSGGAGFKAMNLALEDLTGVADGFRGISFAGNTDPLIFREALSIHGLDCDDGMLERLTRGYLGHLPRLLQESAAVLKPGVPKILEEIRTMERVYLGLLTGNVEEGARLKLGRFNLNGFFPIGAFASDHEDRNELLPIAVERLRNFCGISVAYADCVVVGDSPKDVECARVHGARSIAVATGRYSVAELEDTSADLVLPDLSVTGRIVEWIGAF